MGWKTVKAGPARLGDNSVAKETSTPQVPLKETKPEAKPTPFSSQGDPKTGQPTPTPMKPSEANKKAETKSK